MVTEFTCLNCGTNKPTHAKFYDGALGYAAIICTQCGASHDQSGMTTADEFSLRFVGLKKEPKVYKFREDLFESMLKTIFARGEEHRSDPVNTDSFKSLMDKYKDVDFSCFK